MADGKTAGYTLTEVVIVLILIGILSATAVPRFFGTSEFKARFFFDDVLNATRYAQKVAIASGCDTQVATTATSVTLNQRANCTSGSFTQGVINPSGNSPTYVVNAPSGVSLTTSGGAFPIYFDALGRARRSNGIVGNSYTITIGARTMTIVGETGFTYASS